MRFSNGTEAEMDLYLVLGLGMLLLMSAAIGALAVHAKLRPKGRHR
jgi:hypothetical protein